MTVETVRVFDSVWDALEDTPQEAANMRLRSEVVAALRAAVEAWGLSEAQAASRLGVTQPRLSDLLRGRTERFGLEGLVALAERAGLVVRMVLLPAA